MMGLLAQLLPYLEARKKILFDPKVTWEGSGPPWSETAKDNKTGYDMAVAEVKKYIETPSPMWLYINKVVQSPDPSIYSVRDPEFQQLSKVEQDAVVAYFDKDGLAKARRAYQDSLKPPAPPAPEEIPF